MRVDISEALGIGDYEIRSAAERREGVSQSVRRRGHHLTLAVEKLAYGLDLRQNQTAFWCLDVLWHDEKHEASVFQHVSQNLFLHVFIRKSVLYRFAQGVYP